LTSYLHGLATLSSTSTVLTFVISQANPGDGTEVMFDSKENTTTSHAPSLDVTFGNGDIANITGHPFYSEVSGTSFEFVSTLAGYTLKAGEKIVLIGDVVLSATGATAFDVNFGYENDDSYYAPNPVSTATLQHISTTAAIQPESFTRTVIFTAPTDASYVIGMVVGNVSGSPVNSPSNTDVTIIPLQ
ncbi:MAG TPA: hypothetical protein VHY22_01515, partial [Chthoniobacteraceae bacterium]|nr:hypothetical protein [Chthoniobacteraceae bacterium]